MSGKVILFPQTSVPMVETPEGKLLSLRFFAHPMAAAAGGPVHHGIEFGPPQDVVEYTSPLEAFEAYAEETGFLDDLLDPSRRR